MRKHMRSALFVLTALGAPLSLTGCGKLVMAAKKSDIRIETNINEGVFLEPVGKAQMRAYVRVRNNTGQSLGVEQALRAELAAQGIRVVDDPKNATHTLEANILKMGRYAEEDAAALSLGYGAAIGAAAGGVLAASSGNYSNVPSYAIGGGAIGAAVGLGSFLVDSFIDDVYYNIIADVQIGERINAPGAKESVAYTAQSGSSTTRSGMYHRQLEWTLHRTRMMTTANQVNLKLEDAKEPLKQNLAKAIAGFL